MIITRIDGFKFANMATVINFSFNGTMKKELFRNDDLKCKEIKGTRESICKIFNEINAICNNKLIISL